jgi:hypothetical protein
VPAEGPATGDGDARQQPLSYSRTVNEPPPPERGLANRWILAIVYAVAFAFVAVALVFFVQLRLPVGGGSFPIVAVLVLAFFAFVLYRNRSRRGAR